jgi:hypothetical protein
MMLRLFGILRDPTRMSHDLMVGQVVILGDPSPRFFVVVVLFIPLRPNLVVVELSNQKVDILTRVIHGFCPLVLQIFLIRKKTAITRQIGRRQELQTDSIDVAPDVGIRLETGVSLLQAINDGLQSNLKKADD